LNVESPEEMFTCLICGIFWPPIAEGETECDDFYCPFREADMCLDYDDFVKQGEVVARYSQLRRQRRRNA
jgi:hypothetical protein